MNLKDTLDRITEIIRTLQHRQQSKDDLITFLQDITIVVGQALLQRDSATEKLKKYDKQLWLSHIVGQVDCPDCACQFPIDFFVGSKGIEGQTMTSGSIDQLIERLEFPPITKEDLKNTPIPDCMPDLGP